jgi:hypothetical protein
MCMSSSKNYISQATWTLGVLFSTMSPLFTSPSFGLGTTCLADNIILWVQSDGRSCLRDREKIIRL